MAIHQIIQHQEIKGSLSEVWNFFSNPRNLQTITPDYMDFRITSGELPTDIYPGQIITYSVSPIAGIPLFWMSEIKQVIPFKMFIDEQRKGPYKLWHHEHRFEEQNGMVRMTDIVHYQLPYWLFGELAGNVFIKKQLSRIFEFRKKKVMDLFP